MYRLHDHVIIILILERGKGNWTLSMPPISIPSSPPSSPWPIPKFKLTIEDLDHEGVDIFLSAVQPKVALREAVIASFKWLYTPETVPTQLVFNDLLNHQSV